MMSLEPLHFIGCYDVDQSRIPVNSTLGVIKCSDFYEIQSTKGSTSFLCVCVLLRNTIKVNLLLKAILDKLNVDAYFCAHHYGATGRVVFTSNAH